MNFTHKKPNPIGSRKGFALILALGLMSLVLLLLVSFSALIQVESTASDNQRNSLIARQNALIGAYQALGALQQYAGPDRVVTARGDIYGRDVVHPLWTGVWSTTNATANPTWLVSGKYSEDASAFEVFPTSSSPFTQTVVISKANRPSTSNDGLFYDNGEVKVGRMNISSGDSSSGGYAWWVADEGTKASFARMNTTDGNTASVSDPTLTISSNSTVIARSRQYMLARAGLEDSLLNAVQTDGQLGGGSFEAYLDRGNNLDALMRLSSVKDLNYLDENLFPQSSLNGTSERMSRPTSTISTPVPMAC